MSDKTTSPMQNQDGKTSTKFEYNLECVDGGWVGRCVLLQASDLNPLVTHDSSAGTLPLVFETVKDAERFRDGLAENLAEIIQASSGLPFEQAVEFAKKESADNLIPAIPSPGVLGNDQPVYLVSF